MYALMAKCEQLCKNKEQTLELQQHVFVEIVTKESLVLNTKYFKVLEFVFVWNLDTFEM